MMIENEHLRKMLLIQDNSGILEEDLRSKIAEAEKKVIGASAAAAGL